MNIIHKFTPQTFDDGKLSCFLQKKTEREGIVLSEDKGAVIPKLWELVLCQMSMELCVPESIFLLSFVTK